MIAAELPLLAHKMARRKQRWLAPREKCAVTSLRTASHATFQRASFCAMRAATP